MFRRSDKRRGMEDNNRVHMKIGWSIFYCMVFTSWLALWWTCSGTAAEQAVGWAITNNRNDLVSLLQQLSCSTAHTFRELRAGTAPICFSCWSPELLLYKMFYILSVVNLQSQPQEVDGIILTRESRKLEFRPVTWPERPEQNWDPVSDAINHCRSCPTPDCRAAQASTCVF